jgi:uncharacterized protein (DUF2141 family)
MESRMQGVGRSFASAVLALAMVSFAAFVAAAEEEAKVGTLAIVVVDLKNDDGHLSVALFDSAESYSEEDRVFRTAQSKVKGGRSELEFADVPFGTYALKIYHDENANDKLDTNFVGFPKEGFGFSNDAMGKFGPPKFEQAKFEFSQPRLELTIHAK